MFLNAAKMLAGQVVSGRSCAGMILMTLGERCDTHNNLRRCNMQIKLWPQNGKLSLLTLVLGMVIGMTASSYAQQIFDRIVLGRSGTVSGVATFMPPDGTGWYHIDNPGLQRLRISGGNSPGQYEYMTISHPGKVTVHGDLDVRGNLSERGHSVGTSSSATIGPLPSQGGKADDARPQDVKNLQRQIDILWLKMEKVINRIDGQ